MKDMIRDIGLNVIAAEVSFVIKLGMDTVPVRNAAIGQALYELIRCFLTEFRGDEGIPILRVHCFQKYDSTVKSRVEAFVKKYKTHKPEYSKLMKSLQEIREGEYICVLPSGLEIYGENIWKIAQELEERNGKECKVLLLKEYNSYHYGEKPHTRIGHQDKNLRKCRWCGRTIATGAQFRTKAHAITEALGNKNVILLDECDDCNKKFGNTIERSIATLFRFPNIFFCVQGKRGIPEIKDISGTSSIKQTAKGLSIRVLENFLDFENGVPAGMKLSIEKKYIAADVYKSLCKYALGVVKDESILPEFEKTISWINGEIIWDKLPIVKMLCAKRIFSEHPCIIIYVRRTVNSEYPRMYAEFIHACFVMVYIIPRNEEEALKFSDGANYSRFWNLTLYEYNQGWSDWNFADYSSKTLQLKFILDKETQNDEKNGRKNDVAP